MEATLVPRARPDEQETGDVELADFAAEEAAAEEAAVAAAAEVMDDAALEAVPDATLIRALSFVTTGNEETLTGETSEELKTSALENRVNSRSFLYEFNREGGVRSGSRTLSSGSGSFSSPGSPVKSPKKLSREMSRDLEDLGVVAVEEVDESDEEGEEGETNLTADRTDVTEQPPGATSPLTSQLQHKPSWLSSFSEYEMRRSKAEAEVAEGRIHDTQIDVYKGPIPIQQQVNLDMYEEKNQKRRSIVKRSEDVTRLVAVLWNVTTQTDKIEQSDYLVMVSKFSRVIVPKGHYTEEELLELSRKDWTRDCDGKSSIDYDMFFRSIWELVDTWCETADKDEYVEMLQRLIDATTVSTPTKVEWKKDKDIHYDPYFCFDNQRSDTIDEAAGAHQGVAISENEALDGVSMSAEGDAATKKKKRKPTFPHASHKTSFLSIQKCCKLISMIYSKKLLADIFTERSFFSSKNDKKVNFDNFVIRLFLLQGGTRGIARRNLRAFTRSVEHHASGEKSHPRIRVFRALAGLNASHYDAELLEKFAANVFRAVVPSTQLETFLGDGVKAVLVSKKRFLKAAIPSGAIDVEEGIRLVDKVKKEIDGISLGAHNRMVDLDRAMVLVLPMWEFFNSSLLIKRRAAARALQGLLRRARERIAARREDTEANKPEVDGTPAATPGQATSAEDAAAATEASSRPKTKLEEARKLDEELSEQQSASAAAQGDDSKDS